MIKIVQFCVLIVYVVILYSILTEVLAQTASQKESGCTVFKVSTSTQNFEQIRNDHTILAYGIDPDLNNIPSIKRITRLTGSCRNHRSPNEPLRDPANSDLQSSRSSDPVSYYVFGLRKIIT